MKFRLHRFLIYSGLVYKAITVTDNIIKMQLIIVHYTYNNKASFFSERADKKRFN